MDAVFYEDDKGSRRVRAAGLLASLADAQYGDVCQAVSATPALAFPDLKQLIRNRKIEGQAMVRVS